MKQSEDSSSISLTAKRCAIPGVGIGRIHERNLEPLSLKSGDHIIVKGQDNSIIIKVFADSLIGENDIRLREDDLKRLKIKKNEQVKVQCRL